MAAETDHGRPGHGTIGSPREIGPPPHTDRTGLWIRAAIVVVGALYLARVVGRVRRFA